MDCGCREVLAAENKMDNESSEQEALYLAYLAARVDQALAVVETYQAQLSQNPDDFRCVASLMRAVRDAQSARIDYETQKSLLAGAGIDISESRGTSESSHSAQPTEQFRNQQASKAAQIIGASYAIGRKECPRCHALTPASAARCACGNFFHIGPPLSSKLLASGISVTDHAVPAHPQKDR